MPPPIHLAMIICHNVLAGPDIILTLLHFFFYTKLLMMRPWGRKLLFYFHGWLIYPLACCLWRHVRETDSRVKRKREDRIFQNRLKRRGEQNQPLQIIGDSSQKPAARPHYDPNLRQEDSETSSDTSSDDESKLSYCRQSRLESRRNACKDS